MKNPRVKLMLIVGLDLAGVETRPKGFCLLAEMKAKTCLLFTNEKILGKKLITLDRK